jgi:zinc protease
MSGPQVIIEPSPDAPLVWFEVAIRGGAALDPPGIEGLHRHAALLARRGAGKRDRTQIDDALDSLGTSIDVNVTRDSVSISGLALSRHIGTAIEVCADILAAPRFEEEEHERLLRETPQMLDEIRDDELALATRWFDRVCCPGHPYSRTVIGTEASIPRIKHSTAVELWRKEVVAENVVIGLAGDVDGATTPKLVDRLIERLPQGKPVAQPDVAGRGESGRRMILVDKPGRTQAQIRIGHVSERYGGPDTPALTIAETIFGGMFTSRLMQELRVKRGWTYDAACAVRRSRMPHWFEIFAATNIEVAGPAVALMLELLADFAEHGPTDDEVDFARSYLVGSMPFHVATAHLRMQLAMRDAIFDLPIGYSAHLPALVGEVTAHDVRATCARHFHPDDAVTVAVTTSERARDGLAAAGAGPLTVVKHDEY